jgi:hypothetical protein
MNNFMGYTPFNNFVFCTSLLLVSVFFNEIVKLKKGDDYWKQFLQN